MPLSRTADAVTRVLCAHEHPLVLRGLCAILQPNRQLLIIPVSTVDASPGRFDLLVTSPGAEGLAFFRALMKAAPHLAQVPRIFVLNGVRANWWAELLDPDTRGCVDCATAADELPTAVLQVGAGDRFTSPTLRDALRRLETARARALVVRQRVTEMTHRERAVFDLLARGLSLKEVGHALGIRPKTVTSHRRAILGRLGLFPADRLDLLAQELGLVEGDPSPPRVRV